MEPLDEPPVVEYLIAGEDAERICARGFAALRAAAIGHQRHADRDGFERYGEGYPHIYVTTPEHPAHPAWVVMGSPPACIDCVMALTLCAYGPAQASLSFAQSFGFSPDRIRVRTGRIGAAR